MRSQLIRPALLAVRAAGGDADGLRGRFGLPPSAEDDPDAVLALPDFGAFLEAAAAEARQPSLGLRLAEAAQTGTFGVAEYACRTAPDVGEALRRLGRYIALLNDLVRIDVTPAADGAVVVEQRVPGQPLALGRHANEFFVAVVIVSIARLTGARCGARRVWLAHPDPTDREALMTICGTRDLRVGAEANGIAIDAAVLERGLVSADANLHRIMGGQAERALRERSDVSSGRARVRQAMREHLDAGTPTLASTAARLGMSARTLQRRLTGDETTFQIELDSVRAQLAEVYLADAGLSLGEIAFLLGYADLSAFGRAYRRWTGASPAEARRGVSGR